MSSDSPLWPDSLMPVQFGPYRILRRLGKGGMGTVYLASDTRLDRNVAIKVCHLDDNPQAKKRFQTEAKAAAGLSHTNLCPVHEFDVRDGIAYLAMGYVEGPTLDNWVAQRGGLKQREAALLVAKLAMALQTAHEKKVVHRDLKPGNIVINKNGEPVILDFGLARQMDDPNSRLTQLGHIYGTPSYMAPEQAGGDPATVGPAADIYALGSILYELLAGQVPLPGESLTLMQFLNKVWNTIPPTVRSLKPSVDAELDAICMKALAKKPEDRQASMKELAKALMKVVRAAPSSTRVQVPSPQPAPEPTAVTLPDIALQPTMKFVPLPKVTFYMGWDGPGKPGKKTKIDQDFEIAIHTVTQSQWAAIMDGEDKYPSKFRRGGEYAKDVEQISDEELTRFPVENVSWDMVQKFIEKLNEKYRASGWTYRLPTEAEWEYACRGGATSQEECSHHFYFDKPTDDLSAGQANFDGRYPFGKGEKSETYLGRPVTVDSNQYKPNKLGLCHMHGNVWQWCSDLYEEGGSVRVFRGGCWYNFGSYCRAAYRFWYAPPYRINDLGFRLARVPVK